MTAVIVGEIVLMTVQQSEREVTVLAIFRKRALISYRLPGGRLMRGWRRGHWDQGVFMLELT